MRVFPSSIRSMRRTALAALVFAATATAAGAADWYVSPKGTPQGQGSRDAPWDIESALLGKRAVQAGDTLYLLAGTYRRRPDEKFAVRLTGTTGRPTHVRPAPG